MKHTLQENEPYRQKDDWRVDNRLFDVWIMWHFTETNENGKTIYGYETINTTSKLLNKYL